MRYTNQRGRAFVLILAIVAGCSPAASTSNTGPTSPPETTAVSECTTPPARTPDPTTGLPAFGQDEPLVMFALRTDLGGGIFVMHLDGTNRLQLATDVLPGVHKAPDWSPDGQHVVFVDEQVSGLRIAHLDGSPTDVVEACRNLACDDPAWSPDGTRIAFTVNESKEGIEAPSASSIMVLTLATGEVQPVVRLERPILAQAARWSPDGSQLVIQVDQMDDEAFETGAAIAVVPLAGGEPRYLTAFDVFAGSPDWGWTRDEIVYAVDLAGFQRTPPGDDIAWELFAVKPDGTGLRQITTLGAGGRLHAPRWAPSGASIIAKQYDHNAGGGRLVEPVTGDVTAFLTGLEEARPLMRPAVTAP